MKYPRRYLSDYPVVWVPLGLVAFGLVAICSTLWPPEWKRRK